MGTATVDLTASETPEIVTGGVVPPQHFTVPAPTIAYPLETATASLIPLTEIGVDACVVVPSPRRPPELSPQHMTEPTALTAHEVNRVGADVQPYCVGDTHGRHRNRRIGIAVANLTVLA